MVSGTGMMLGSPERGGAGLVAQSTPQLPPEEAAVWNTFHKGYGVRIESQDGSDTGHYYYALGVDGSIEGQLIQGPLITTVTPTGSLDTTNGISHFFELAGVLYALNGRYVKERTADSAAGWGTTEKDFGVGKAATDVIVHKQNGGSTLYAYVGMGASELYYRFDGTTWTQHATQFAQALVIVGREVYRAQSTNLVAKLSANADPWTAGNWTADAKFRVGEQNSAITRMAVTASGYLVIFKTDGVYVLDEEGGDTQLYSFLKGAPDSTNGYWNFQYENYLHITLSGRHSRIGPDLALEHIGPERLAQNDSAVKGYITAGVGTPFAAYAGLYNPDSGGSYLMKFGAWTTGDQPERLDAWHGSISQAYASKKITAMTRSTIGADSGHERVYIGFSDGTIGWFQLPCVPNPYACSNYDYNAAASANYLFLPAWHAGELHLEKHLRVWAVNSQGLGTPTIDVGVGTIGGSFTEVAFSTSPGEREELATDTAYAMADIRIELKGSGTFRLLGLELAFARRAAPGLAFEFAVLCEDGLVKRDGTRIFIGADQIRSLLRTAWLTEGSVTVVFPDESSQEVTITDYAEAQVWDGRSSRWRAGVKIGAVQAQRLTVLAGAASETLA